MYFVQTPDQHREQGSNVPATPLHYVNDHARVNVYVWNVILVMYGHSGTGLREWAPDKDQKPLQCVNTGQTENGFFIVQINGDRVRAAYRAKRYTEEKLPDGKTKRNWDGTWGWRHVLDTKLASSTSRGPAASR